jgi:hypothetical protein
MATPTNRTTSSVRSLFEFLASPRPRETFPLQREFSSQSSSGISTFSLDDPDCINSDDEVDGDSGSLKARAQAVLEIFLRDLAYPPYTSANVPRGVDMALIERVIARTSPWVEERDEGSKWTRVSEQAAAMADVSFPSIFLSIARHFDFLHCRWRLANIASNSENKSQYLPGKYRLLAPT